MGIFKKRPIDEVDTEAEEERLLSEVAVVEAVLRHYAPGKKLNFGAPTRCPRCGDYGFVQSVNATYGAAHSHCFSCDADWVVTRRALDYVRLVASSADAGVLFEAPQPEMTPTDAETAEDVDTPPPAPSLFKRQDERAPPPVRSVTEAMRNALQAAAAEAPAERAAPVEPVAPVAPVVSSSRAVPAGDDAYTTWARRVESSAADPADAPLRVLIIEDNPFDLAVLEEVLDDAAGSYATGPDAIEVVHAATLLEGQRIAAAGDIDLVLLDLNLPDSEGVTTLLEWQHNVMAVIPVIVLSGINDPDLMLEVRALGVAHFIQKSHLVALADDPAIGRQRLLRLLRKAAGQAPKPLTDAG